MLLSAFGNATVDRVELGFVDQERVVLRMDVRVVGGLGEVEADAVVERHRKEGPELLRLRQSEDLGEVVRGLPPVLRPPVRLTA